MNAGFFFEANVLGSELKCSRKQVDKTVLLNDSNCCWQSISSEEIVHRASFLTGELCFLSHFWWALNFP